MKKRKHHAAPHYSLLDVMTASPIQPLQQSTRTSQLLRMWDGLAQLETAENPAPDNWRVCADAVNLLETLVEMGEVQDSSGLLVNAVTAMGEAGERAMNGGVIRLSGLGIQAIRAVLEDYAEVLGLLPARIMILAHRKTEKRIREIYQGKGRAHDVQVVSV